MKRVVSVSLGSAKRNHVVDVEFLGQACRVERIGTDGVLGEMVKLIERLDGEVAAFGLGGMDLYIFAGKKRYTLREAKDVVKSAKLSPILDGSGLKNTLERKVIQYLQENTDLLRGAPKVLMMHGTDRFGMTEALNAAGCRLTMGDLIFTIGLPLPLRSLKALEIAAGILAPLLCQLPLAMLYPIGKKQDENTPKATALFAEAELIAGDFHAIRRYMPLDLRGKTIITNTTTREDVTILAERGVKVLVTTTPELNGRTFGTNVMEALLVAISGKRRELGAAEYEELLNAINFTPRITYLQQ
ncbi:MAG: hypothetical protein DDT29_02302 [Dehalococcoidia bacterium]|nr:hypothetical protein [Bacillota bacterium]MBT9149373.1 hypothetical protein [Chloroflexota bacterium]